MKLIDNMKPMVARDQMPLLLGIGAIVVTLSAGTCSTNVRIGDLNDNIGNRFDDMNRRIDDVNQRFDDVNQRIDDVNRRFDDVNRRIDEVQTNVRELRGLLFESLKSDAPVN